MTNVAKDGVVMAARDVHQLAAFLNNGWSVSNETTTHENNVEDEPLPFSDDNIEFEEKQQEKQYTKTEINRMTTAELREVAFNNGFENAYEMTGGDLKKTLIEHFGL